MQVSKKKQLSTLHYNQYNRDFFSKLCASCRVYKLRISWDIKNNNVASVLKGQIFKNYKPFQCMWVMDTFFLQLQAII